MLVDQGWRSWVCEGSVYRALEHMHTSRCSVSFIHTHMRPNLVQPMLIFKSL